MPVRLRVYCRGSSFPDDARDLSLGGLCVESTQPLPAGTQLELELEIPQRDVRIQLPGEVVWSRREGQRSGMGVRFTGGTELQRELLASYIERVSKDFERL